MYGILCIFHIDTDRLHQSPAIRRAVARVYIHMLSPKASRAMVSIPVAFYVCSAFFTNKVFDSTLKFFRLHLWRYGDSNPRPLPCHGSALPAELYPRWVNFRQIPVCLWRKLVTRYLSILFLKTLSVNEMFVLNSLYGK